jgi:UDP-N-acetylglucosamine--N-acetylmuramyl-(pentapeptide) pyrophosphoryl-undecaprenol N-acetylglucosamine transferase
MNGPILVTAGGTGGHLFPAEALTQELTRRGRKVLFVTDIRGTGFAQDYPGVEIARIPAATFAGRGILGAPKAALEIARGTSKARALIIEAQPVAAIGFGGYPALPAIWAALSKRLPCAVHEQNSVLGRVNRFFAARVKAIASSFPVLYSIKPQDKNKVVITGNPVRPGISAVAGSAYTPPQPGGPIKIAVFGGSQGARIMSEIVPPAIKSLPQELRDRIEVVQQCRKEDLEAVRAAYFNARVAAELAHFFHDVPRKLVEAHVVIGRAGASTCAELMAIGRPSILVPYPFAMDDHQTYNAMSLAEAGAAIRVQQTEFNSERLASLLQELIAAPERLAGMAKAAGALGRPGAAVALADLVEQLAASQAAPARSARAAL